jgi:hypothetical protein
MSYTSYAMKNINRLLLLQLSLAVALIGNATTVNASGDATQQTNTALTHHVHLTGYGGDNEANRKTLLDQYHACANGLTNSGRRIVPLPQGGVPKIIFSENVDIDYGVNMSMTRFEGEFFYVDMSDCGIRSEPHKHATLLSSAGECKIDYLKKTAQGQCDINRHINAGRRFTPDEKIADAISRLPADKRALVEKGLRAKAVTSTAASNNASPLVTGETRRIANVLCQSYTLPTTGAEFCIANPPGTFPIPVSPLNLLKAGLLLEVKQAAMTLVADRVSLNQAADASLFVIPRDFSINEILVPQRSHQQ